MLKGIFAYLLIFGFLLVTAVTSILAQDARLAQFYKAPQLLNPALTGVFTGKFRFNSNYRDQWSSILGGNPYRTIHTGIDAKFASFGDDFFGLGWHATMDQAGNGHLRQSRSYLSGSYAKQITGTAYSDQSQFLIAGAQFGFGQNTIDWNRLWFSDQFDTNVRYPNLDDPTAEVWNNEPQGQTPLFIDFNVGLLWYATWAQNGSFYLGGVLHHLGQPQISLVNENEQLDLRWVIHMGGQLPFNKNLSLLPGLQIQNQGDRASVAFGANIRLTNNDRKETAIRAGFWPHFSGKATGGFFMDEWTTAFILEWEKWDIGISYGINSSGLKLATLARGAFELSLLYTSPGRDKIKTRCPKL